jgi:hypothetical protein
MAVVRSFALSKTVRHHELFFPPGPTVCSGFANGDAGYRARSFVAHRARLVRAPQLVKQKG